LKRDTLTVTPCEPRMLSENAYRAIKSLNLEKLIIGAPLESKGTLEAVSKQTQPEIEVIKEPKMAEKEQELDNNQILTEAVKGLTETVKDMQRTLPAAMKAGYNVTVTHDEADTPFASIGAQMEAIKNATLTQGRELAPRLKALNIKALGANELIGAEGGFMLEPTFAAGILAPLHDTGPFSSRANKIAIGPNSNGITIRAIDETNRTAGYRWGGILGYRLAEAGTKLATTPTFRLLEMRLKKYAVLVYATEELLQDSTALAGIISQGCSEELDFMVNDDILNGAGNSGPLGILNSGALVSVTKEAGQAAATVVTQNIFKMWSRMHPASKSNAVWFINTDVTPQLYQLSLSVGTGGMPMYMSPGSLPNAPSGQLLGRPVVETEYNATLGTVGDIVLADMSQYAMIDRDVQAASSIHVQFLTDQICYRFVYRVDGMPKIAKPLTPANGSNTLTPFVALATRA
jgi:HK97 family phage major capsid protein